MLPQNATKAGTGVSGPDLRIPNRLASAIGSEAYKERSAACQSLRRLTARLDALCVWKEDIERRIADANARLWEPNWFFCRVYKDVVDDLAGATRAWRLAAASVVVDLDAADHDLRRKVGVA